MLRRAMPGSLIYASQWFSRNFQWLAGEPVLIIYWEFNSGDRYRNHNYNHYTATVVRN